MYRLCYISSARVPIDDAFIESVLAVSRRNNRASGVTGLLVAGGKRLLQLLEGDETAVRDTYRRIRRDPRHFACVVISEARIPACQFDQWDMGLVRPGDAGDEQAALADIIAGIADRNLRVQFDGFLAINGGQRSAA